MVTFELQFIFGKLSITPKDNYEKIQVERWIKILQEKDVLENWNYKENNINPKINR